MRTKSWPLRSSHTLCYRWLSKMGQNGHWLRTCIHQWDHPARSTPNPHYYWEYLVHHCDVWMVPWRIQCRHLALALVGSGHQHKLEPIAQRVNWNWVVTPNSSLLWNLTRTDLLNTESWHQFKVKQFNSITRSSGRSEEKKKGPSCSPNKSERHGQYFTGKHLQTRQKGGGLCLFW